MRAALGIIAGVLAINASLVDVQAAEKPISGCEGSCITVVQSLDGVGTVGSFPMTCSTSGQKCYGEGQLTVFNEAVPVAATGIFSVGGISIAFYTKAGNLDGRAIFFTLDGRGTSKPMTLTTIVQAPKAPPPRRTVKTENDVIPGTIQVLVSGYRPKSAFVPLD